MAIRYNSSITNSRIKPPGVKQTLSLDSIRRNTRDRNNKSIKLRQKVFTIYGGPKTPEIVSSLLWDFNEPGGTEVVNYTFNFSGSISVLDFGDGTSQDSVTSGQTITKSYS